MPPRAAGGGTGTGKTRLAIVIVRACIRDGARARFYNVVDLVNRLEAEARASRQGRIAGHFARLDLVVLDELEYLVARGAEGAASQWKGSGLRTSSPR